MQNKRKEPTKQWTGEGQQIIFCKNFSFSLGSNDIEM